MRPTYEGLFHITARSNAEERIFRDDGDYLVGLSVVAAAPLTIHTINRNYAVTFNRRWKRHGHVFDSPATTVPVTSEPHLLEVIRYIANNPPRPESWPYSSFAGTLGLRPQFSFVDDELVKSLFASTDDLRRFAADRRIQEPGSANQVPGLA